MSTMSKAQFEIEAVLVETLDKLTGENGVLRNPPCYVVLQVCTPEGAESHIGYIGRDVRTACNYMATTLAHIALNNAAQLKHDFQTEGTLSSNAKVILEGALECVDELIAEQQKHGITYDWEIPK